MTEAYIYDAVRTPRGKGRADGSLHEVTAPRLSAIALNALKDRNNLDGHAVEDVVWGNVSQVAEQGACLARTAVLASELDESIPGLSINRFCASGLEAVNVAANQVRGGAGNGYIAGGVECMSRVPMGSDGGAIAVDPSLAIEHYFVPQGIGADIIATKYGFSRDDAGRFIPRYLERKLIEHDPFVSLDRRAVGRLLEMAVSESRARKKGIKYGVCGEHGGDPRSIRFFHDLGLDYVSCSPFRVPIARIAAAQANVAAELGE